ncbi:MAG: hypothetical protein VYC34_03770, partial [Planctomycetota bacterium]|nr:hypothetical protein [Planctomycetota bacterium]
IALTAAALATAATAGVPSYQTPELKARSNFSGAYNLANSFFFTNRTPSINDHGEVAITIGVAASTDTSRLWYSGVNEPMGVYSTPSGGFLSDASLNNSGVIVDVQSFTIPEGIVEVDVPNMTSGLGVGAGGPFGVIDWSTALINDLGQIGFRATTGSGTQAYVSVDTDNTQAKHVEEILGSPYSFLFTPAFNNARQIAGKARVGMAGQTGGSQPDEIRIWNSDGSSILIAEDRDSNINSPYTGFDNSVSLTDNGFVSFTANLAAGGRGVFLSDGTTTVTIATEADANVSNIEFFSSSANEQGLVAFRAFNGAGLRAIFVGDGTTLVEVITEHDLVPTDLGTARIDQNDSSPTFGGAPRLNVHGDLAFQCPLTPPDNNQIEWGSGIFVMAACPPADLNGDCVVNSADLGVLLGSWGPCPMGGGCPADLDGDGVVGPADLGALLGSWS